MFRIILLALVILAGCSAPTNYTPPPPVTVLIDPGLTAEETEMVLAGLGDWSGAGCLRLVATVASSDARTWDEAPEGTIVVRRGRPVAGRVGGTTWASGGGVRAVVEFYEVIQPNVVRHELGHALDLTFDGHDHQENPDVPSVMAPAVSAAEVIQPADVGAINSRWCR